MRAVLLLVALACGCGGPPDAVRHTISVTATGLAGVDEVLATRYSIHADTCRAHSDDWEEYDTCMTTMEIAADAAQSSRETLLSLEAAADAWEEGSDEQWANLVGCLAISLASLASAGRSVGITLPSEVGKAIELAASFGGECHADN